MNAVSLLYHDVICNGTYDSSGFGGAGAARYKLTSSEFDLHLSALKHTLSANPVTVTEALQLSHRSKPVMLTFDDGGISAYPRICDALDRNGWKGHFFITTNCIGRPTFVGKEDIRTLRKRGHVIGSHSNSHPERMPSQSRDALMEEWKTSINRLSDILGEEVNTASVPNGYYSRKVAETASLSGIKALFTSEPVKTTHSVEGCIVFGRYIVWPGMAPQAVVALALHRRWPCCRKFVLWNLKKVPKLVGGEAYLKARRLLLRHSEHSLPRS